MRSDLVDVAGEIQGETSGAYRFYDGDRTVWLPKSQRGDCYRPPHMEYRVGQPE
jgi:hypothetical protein